MGMDSQGFDNQSVAPASIADTVNEIQAGQRLRQDGGVR